MLERLLHRFGFPERDTDRGATAILVAGSLLMLMGFAAIAVDVARGFTERRVDQTSADMAATAGGVEVKLGVFGGGTTGDDMVDVALQYARLNLPTQYSDTEWQALWEGCTDLSRNEQPGDDFVALSAPSGWTVADPANWCMSIDQGKSLFRVRVPDQAVDTTFGRLLGVTQLYPSAAAVVTLDTEGAGILPFGIPNGVTDGLQCLYHDDPGKAKDPCDGPDAGNFGVLDVALFEPGCPPNPNIQGRLALNIAAGVDHIVLVKQASDPAIADGCYPPVGTFVNSLWTRTGSGSSNSVEAGLAKGGSPLPAGQTALLQLGPQDKENVEGNLLDDAPLWDWLITAAGAPSSCVPGTVSTWEDMQACLDDYDSGGHDQVIFDPDIGYHQGDNWSPRFGYAPQFWQTSLGTGASELKNVLRYRAVFIQGTWWEKNSNTWLVHHPGEGCTDANGDPKDCNPPGNYRLQQVSGFIIPDAALPPELRGDPPGDVLGINPFTLRVAR